MQKAKQILQAVQKMGEKRIPLTRVYHKVFDNSCLRLHSQLYRF